MSLITLRTSRFLLTIMTLLALPGCKTTDIRGQSVDEAIISQLVIGQQSKDQVTELLGTPTITPSYSPTWYYVQRTVSHRAWLSPKIVQQKILRIKFDDLGILQEALILNDSHLDEIKVIEKYTKTYGTQLNTFQKFTKNIGRFSKPQDTKARGQK